jgi:hypothetical protein
VYGIERAEDSVSVKAVSGIELERQVREENERI